jgi:hypothetical protein
MKKPTLQEQQILANFMTLYNDKQKKQKEAAGKERMALRGDLVADGRFNLDRTEGYNNRALMDSRDF